MKTSRILASMLALALAACSNGTTTPPDGGAVPGPDASVSARDAATAAPDAGAKVTRSYSGSASRGDLVVFQIDPVASTYSVHNETTSQDESGTFTVLEGDLAGVKEVTAGGKSFFAVELTDQLLAANFPVANSQANISAGIRSDLDNTGKESQIAGNYTWIRLSDEEVNGSPSVKTWGVLQVGADGKWKKHDYSTGPGTGTPTVTPLAPEDFAGPFPPTATPQETGTWKVNGTAKERLEVTIDGQAGVTLTGFAYAENDSSVFLLDLGVDKGFMLGLKNPATHIDLASLAGTYKFVDLWYLPGGPFRGAGNYTLPASGDGTYKHKSDDGTIDGGYLKGLKPCPNIPNMFLIDQMQWGDAANPADDNVVRLVVVGDAIIHVTFAADGNFISYGVGAKLQ